VDAQTVEKLILINKSIQVEREAPQKIICMPIPVATETVNNLLIDQIKTPPAKRVM
jgi:hypothetical protein